MRLIAFPQWDRLTSLLRGMARQSAADFAQRNIVRIIPKNGIDKKTLLYNEIRQARRR